MSEIDGAEIISLMECRALKVREVEPWA